MAARTRKKPEPDVVAEVVVKHEPDEQHDKRLDALLKKLDQAMLRITELEATIAQQKAPDDRPWTFDVERDTYGRITEVTAQKDDSKRTLM
jgi:hypothetical protein